MDGSLVSLNCSALSVGGVSQLWLYVRIIWRALKNPDVQTSPQPHYIRISEGETQVLPR